MGLIAASRILAIRTVYTKDGQRGRWCYYQCPRCGHLHGLPIDHPNEQGAKWAWDGNVEYPTFMPSVLSQSGGKIYCHHFVKQGQLEFCGDAPPSDEGVAYAGKTVPIPQLPENWIDQ